MIYDFKSSEQETNRILTMFAGLIPDKNLCERFHKRCRRSGPCFKCGVIGIHITEVLNFDLNSPEDWGLDTVIIVKWNCFECDKQVLWMKLKDFFNINDKEDGKQLTSGGE